MCSDSEYTGAEADELIDHRDSQRPTRCRGPKLEAKGITCWLATVSGTDPSIADKMQVDGNSETSFDDETGAIKVSTSVFIKDPEDLSSNCEYDIYWSCGTPHSLWCRVESKNSRGTARKDAALWMCATKPMTQSRSTKYWCKDGLFCPKPLSSALSEDMGSVKLELYKLKGPIVVLNEAEDDIKTGMLDDAWIVFEFNFKWQALVPHPSSLNSPALVQTKRKREGSPPVTRITRRRCPSQTSSPNVPRLESSPEARHLNSIFGSPLSDVEVEESGSGHSTPTNPRMPIQQATSRPSHMDLINSPSPRSSVHMATQRLSESVSQAPLPSDSSSRGINRANHNTLTSNTGINGSGSKDGRAEAKLLPLSEPTLASNSTSLNDSDHRSEERIQSSTKPSEPTSTASIASTSAQSAVASLNNDLEELEKENRKLAAELDKKREVKRLIAEREERRLAAEREKRCEKLKEENELMKRELAELDLYISKSSGQ